MKNWRNIMVDSFVRVDMLSQLPDANVAEGELAAVITLDCDVPAFRAAVIGPGRELARLHLGFPVGTPELVLEQPGSVQPVLDVCTFRDDSRGVPLAGGLYDTLRSRIEPIRRAC